MAHHTHDHHDHFHPSDSGRKGKAFAVAIALNSVFVVVEFGFGFFANSTALMADAGHNLSDVLGLVLAWSATLLARKAPNDRFTYGLRSSSTLAALANAMLLLIACGAIGWEAVQRFWSTPVVNTVTVMAVATTGIFINGFSAWLFMKDSKNDLNIRGAYLHLAADAGVSLGVVIAAVLIFFTGWNWLDAATSLLIVVVIIFSSWGLLRESVILALHAVPKGVNGAEIEMYLRSLEGVTEIHDLHIWGMSTTETALTAHLVYPKGHPPDEVLDAVTQTLRDKFNIHHCTLQVEHGTTLHACSLHAR